MFGWGRPLLLARQRSSSAWKGRNVSLVRGLSGETRAPNFFGALVSALGFSETVGIQISYWSGFQILMLDLVAECADFNL